MGVFFIKLYIDIDYQLDYNCIIRNDNDYQYRDLGGIL